MYRWITVSLLLAGLGGSGYLSWRGHSGEVKSPGGVTSMEDGTGFPTPKAP